jgi:predicted dehydrogenase
MNRRRFAQLSALTFAATRLPAQAATRRIGIAPVGLGSIAEVFMRAVAQSTTAQITGLVTGHPQEKGTKFGAQYHVPAGSIYTYETYDKIAANKAIDAVYIALPNSMHCEYTVRAAEAGKHVFCEKPMAISSAECRRMIDACRHADVTLMIGYRLHYDATLLHIRDLVRTGAFGDLLTAQGRFCVNHPAGVWRLDRKLNGGGSVMDLGIYPINTISWLTGEQPNDFRAFAANRGDDPRFSEEEQSIEWMMKYPSGVVASCGSSYQRSEPSTLQLNGSAGSVHIEPAFGYGDISYTYTGTTKSGDISGSGSVLKPDQFVSEVDHFSDCVLHHKQPNTGGEEGLADLVAIEAIYKAAGTPIA